QSPRNYADYCKHQRFSGAILKTAHRSNPVPAPGRALASNYFHCDLGRDRTSLIAALYAVYFRGVSTEEAWLEAEHFGFKDAWTLRGLKQYFQIHTQPPITRFIPDCSSEQQKQVTPREQAADESQ